MILVAPPTKVFQENIKRGHTPKLLRFLSLFCSLVRGLIESHRVMMFSKSTCPFCLLAKDTLREAGVKDFNVLEIELRPDAPDIQVGFKYS